VAVCRSALRASQPGDSGTAARLSKRPSPGRRFAFTFVGIYIIGFVVVVIGSTAGVRPIAIAVFAGVAIFLFIVVPPLRIYRRRTKARTGRWPVCARLRVAVFASATRGQMRTVR
jgi:hypothetical protein